MALLSNLRCDEDGEDFVRWGVNGAFSEVSVDDCVPAMFPITGERLRSLLAAEDGYMPQPDYISRYLSCSLELAARHDAINWILKALLFLLEAAIN